MLLYDIYLLPVISNVNKLFRFPILTIKERIKFLVKLLYPTNNNSVSFINL